MKCYLAKVSMNKSALIDISYPTHGPLAPVSMIVFSFKVMLAMNAVAFAMAVSQPPTPVISAALECQYQANIIRQGSAQCSIVTGVETGNPVIQ